MLATDCHTTPFAATQVLHLKMTWWWIVAWLPVAEDLLKQLVVRRRHEFQLECHKQASETGDAKVQYSNDMWERSHQASNRVGHRNEINYTTEKNTMQGCCWMIPTSFAGMTKKNQHVFASQ
jgi:hypothetical protein